EHHFTADRMARDRQRDEWLASEGYKVLRFNTGELSDSFDGCIEEVLQELGLMGRAGTPTPHPSPQGGGEAPALRPVPPDAKRRRTSQGSVLIRPAVAADLPA